jgi:hypothetical protein
VAKSLYLTPDYADFRIEEIILYYERRILYLGENTKYETYNIHDYSMARDSHTSKV